MLISQRLIALSLVGVIALGAVAAVGVFGIRGIDEKFDRLAGETLPTLAALRTTQAHKERALAGMLALSQARDETRVSELHAQTRAELDYLDPSGAGAATPDGANVALFETALNDIQSAVLQRLQGRAEFERAASEARQALTRIADDANVIGTGVQRITAASNEAARSAGEQADRSILEQRSAQKLDALLAELTLLVYATDALQNRFRIAPLQERLRATMDAAQRLGEEVVTMQSLPSLLPDPQQLEGGFSDPESGLFALRLGVLADAPGTKRTYRDARKALVSELDAARNAAGTLIDDLEFRIVLQRKEIDAALKMSGDPAGITAINAQLLLGESALAVDLARLLSAVEPEQVKALQAEANERFDTLGPLAKQLGDELEGSGHDALGRSAASVAEQLQSLGTLFESVANGLLDELRNERRLSTELDELARVTEQQRSIGQSRQEALAVEVNAASGDVDQQVHEASLLIAVLAGVAAVILLLTGLLMTRSIVRRLRQAVEVAESVSSGVLHPVPAAGASDELSRLLIAMGAMVSMLDGSVREIRDATREVGNGATEITQGNVELNERTDRQAVQLSDTAISTANINEALARDVDLSTQASDLVRAASGVAVRGRDVVREAIDSITKVQQGAKQISSITEVIDSIAFQTNILALNAAVEASRAGESGRGFSVVAAEVRLLAQKSKESAQQISAIINDNVRDVEDSSALVRQAGKHIDDVAGNVDAVAQMIEGVSRSGRAQAEAVAGVDRSVGELQRTTGDNAALSVQLRQAAVSMLEQSRRLDASVSVFQLSEPGAARLTKT